MHAVIVCIDNKHNRVVFLREKSPNKIVLDILKNQLLINSTYDEDD